MQLQSFKGDTVTPQAVTFSETEIPFLGEKKEIILCHFSPNVA